MSAVSWHRSGTALWAYVEDARLECARVGPRLWSWLVDAGGGDHSAYTGGTAKSEAAAMSAAQAALPRALAALAVLRGAP